MKTPSQFQAAALAGKYGFASQVSAEADASLEQQIESEKLDIHCRTYSDAREYLDALQAIDAPAEIIEAVFAP